MSIYTAKWIRIGHTNEPELQLNPQKWLIDLMDFSSVVPTDMLLYDNITIKNCTARQSEYMGGNWHVRQTIYPDDIAYIDASENNLTIIMNRIEQEDTIPNDWDELRIAYHVSSTRPKPTGFIDFYKNNELIKRIDNRFIHYENVGTVEECGKFPHLYEKIKHEDVKNILLTNTVAIIQG